MFSKRIIVTTFAAAAALSIAGGAMAQQTVIRLWSGSSSPVEEAFLQEQVALFEEANPDVDVEVLISPDYGTQLQSAFASGDYPEVFTVGQFEFPAYRDSGVLAEGQDKIEDIEGIYPNLLNAFTYEGTAYCPPKDFSTLAVYYNKDMFDAAGLEYPSNDWTWEDMKAAATALTTDDVVGLSASEDTNRWLALFWANGGRLFDDEGNVVVNSPEAVAALEYYASFVQDGVGALPSALDSGWNGEAFGRGKAAMTIEGNWALGFLDESYPELNYGVVELPTAPSGNKATLTFTVCWAVAANAEGAKADAAWRLVNFLTGEEGAARVAEAAFGVMPARPSATDAWIAAKGEIAEPFVTGATYAWAPVWPLGFADFNDVIAQGSKAVMEGTNTAQALLDEAAAVAKEIVEEMN